MWEFISFILFGAVMFMIGGAVIANHWEKRAVESQRLEHRGARYRLTKIDE